MTGGAGVRRAIAVALIVTGLVRAGLAAAGAVASATTSQQVPGGSYGEFTGLTPARVLDARHGLGTPSGQPEWMTSGDTMDVRISGRGGVPANGVTAVVLTVTVEAAVRRLPPGVAGVPSSGASGLGLNPTATNPTTLTYLTVSPGGQSIPLASNLSAYPGRITATAVTVAVLIR